MSLKEEKILTPYEILKQEVEAKYPNLTGRHPCSQETKNKISCAHKGFTHSKETRLKISLAHKGKPSYWKGKHLPIETRLKQSLAQKKLWAMPEHKDKMTKAQMAKGTKVRHNPSKLESVLYKLLQSILPNEYRYTGDGTVVINRQCPDFTNCNRKKQVIELFGDYWHQGENPQDRIGKFAEFGFSCLVIWENEMESLDKLAGKVLKFDKGV